MVALTQGEQEFFVNAYLRSKDSQTAPKGAPYYIGKGRNLRPYEDHRKTPIPADPLNIVILAGNLYEKDALQLEMNLIYLYGRKDNGTGILINHTDGGEGVSGWKHSEETRILIGGSVRNSLKAQASRRSPKKLARLAAWHNTERGKQFTRKAMSKGWDYVRDNWLGSAEAIAHLKNWNDSEEGKSHRERLASHPFRIEKSKQSVRIWNATEEAAKHRRKTLEILRKTYFGTDDHLNQVQSMGKGNKGRIRIHHEILGSKAIKQEEWQKYEANGWKRGMKPRNGFQVLSEVVSSCRL